MLVINGTIHSVCKTSIIPKGSVVKLVVYDASKKLQRLDSIPVPISQKQLFNPTQFPIEYSIEFEDSLQSQYYLSVAIENNQKIIFKNQNPLDEKKNQRHVGDYLGKDDKIRHRLDVYLYETNKP